MKLPMYEQQTSMGSVRADATAFGAGVAEATNQMGDVISQIGEVKQRREELIESTIKARDFDSWAQESLRALETQDLARPETFEMYREGLNKKLEETIGSFRGRGAARDNFRSQLINQSYQYEKSAREAQVKAQYNFIGSEIKGRSNTFATQVAQAPQLLDQILQEADAVVDQYAEALPAGAVTEFRRSNRVDVLTSAMEIMAQSDDFDNLDALLANPEVTKDLTPDVSRRFVIASAAGRAKKEKEIARVESNVSKWRALLGNLTPQQEAVIRNMPPKAERTPVDEIAEWQLLNPNQPVPQSYIDRAYGFVSQDTTGGLFGNSMEGRARQILQELAPIISMGTATPEQSMAWDNAMGIVGQEKSYTDDLGRRVTIPPRVPTFAAEANAMRVRMTPTPMSAGATPIQPNAVQPGQTIEYTAPGAPPRRATVDANGNFSVFAQPGDPDYIEPAPAPSGQTGQSGQPAPGGKEYETAQPGALTSGMSMMDLSPFVTGPMAALATSAPARLGPIAAQVDPRFTEAQTRMNTLHEMVVKAMRPNAQIAEAYRQDLNNLVGLKTQVFDSEENRNRHITGLDVQWRKNLKELDKIISGETPASKEELQTSVELANLYRFVIREFDVPQQRLYTREQVEKLPPGTRFFFGDDHTPRTKK